MTRVIAFLAFAWLCSTGPAVAQVNMDAVLAERPPKLLSQFGLFADLVTGVPSRGVRFYEVRNELFSDHAIKLRYVFVPDGKSAAYHPTEAFEFPVGSVLVKTFAFPADFGKPKENLRKIETRLLLRQNSGWVSYPYVWNDEQTDAVLKIAGKRLSIDFTDPSGEQQTISYKVPNKNQCKGCHAVNKELVPIGPKARNLNFVSNGADISLLQRWVETGLVADAGDSSGWPSVPHWRDESRPLGKRARAWLDINCAHCHRFDGPASNSGLFLTWGETDPSKLGIRKRPVAAGSGTGGFDYSISPGKPEESIMIYRLRSTETGIMMPELGRSLADHEAIDMLARWIEGLD